MVHWWNVLLLNAVAFWLGYEIGYSKAMTFANKGLARLIELARQKLKASS